MGYRPWGPLPGLLARQCKVNPLLAGAHEGCLLRVSEKSVWNFMWNNLISSYNFLQIFCQSLANNIQ